MALQTLCVKLSSMAIAYRCFLLYPTIQRIERTKTTAVSSVFPHKISAYEPSASTRCIEHNTTCNWHFMHARRRQLAVPNTLRLCYCMIRAKITTQLSLFIVQPHSFLLIRCARSDFVHFTCEQEQSIHFYCLWYFSFSSFSSFEISQKFEIEQFLINLCVFFA